MSSSIVYLDMFTANDLKGTGELKAIGAAFDADPRLRPERMDTDEPIRVKVDSAADYLAGIEAMTPRPLRVAFQRKSKPAYVGDFDTRDETAEQLPGLDRLWLSTSDLDWLEDPTNAGVFGELAVRVGGAFDAAYGFATHSKMPWQQRVEFLTAPERGEPATMEPGPFTDRHSLRDVYWLNIYGPAFVERFGSRLDGLGVRRETMSNGGLVIWAAETPFLYDEAIASHRDYPWKQPFYDALGSDAFVHIGQASTGNVPSLDDHRRLVRSGR